GTAGVLLSGGGSDPSGTGTAVGSPRASASASATEAASPVSSQAPSAASDGGLPSGFRRVSGEGWSLAVPDGWRQSGDSSGTRFSDPAGGRYLLVARRDPAGPSAVGAWRDQEKAFRKSHEGYERVRLETISQPGASDAADWEFRYADGGAQLHALDRARVVDGVGYAVFVQSRDSEWAASQALFDQVQQSFRAEG
ncbi:MAG: serine/threonine protein kinase, partial [Frankiales bacterium]|nr:serine/threonine protein kinase [Frankiales bacterium]